MTTVTAYGTSHFFWGGGFWGVFFGSAVYSTASLCLTLPFNFTDSFDVQFGHCPLPFLTIQPLVTLAPVCVLLATHVAAPFFISPAMATLIIRGSRASGVPDSHRRGSVAGPRSPTFRSKSVGSIHIAYLPPSYHSANTTTSHHYITTTLHHHITTTTPQHHNTQATSTTEKCITGYPRYPYLKTRLCGWSHSAVGRVVGRMGRGGGATHVAGIGGACVLYGSERLYATSERTTKHANGSTQIAKVERSRS